MATALESEKNTVPNMDGEYMNKEQLEYFKALLESQKNELIAEGEKTRAYLKDERVPTADLNDRASQEEEFALELRTRDRENKLIKKINKALKRIETGDFGYCEQCGEEIGVGRLNARPTAELCIDCKHLTERKEKGFFDQR